MGLPIFMVYKRNENIEKTKHNYISTAVANVLMMSKRSTDAYEKLNLSDRKKVCSSLRNAIHHYKNTCLEPMSWEDESEEHDIDYKIISCSVGEDYDQPVENIDYVMKHVEASTNHKLCAHCHIWSNEWERNPTLHEYKEYM
jgi:hypothetical protein